MKMFNRRKYGIPKYYYVPEGGGIKKFFKSGREAWILSVRSHCPDKQLEKELGIRLFERVGKGAVLTESGQDFVFHANEILNTAKQAVDAVRGSEKKQSEREITGVLRVGGVESVSTALLPEILMEFHRICPQVEIVVHTSKRDVLMKKSAATVWIFF